VLLVSMSSLCCTVYVNPSINFNFLSNSYSYYVTIWSVCYFHWMASQNRWLHNRSSSCILVTSCILQLTPNAWQTILISHQYHQIHFFEIFILNEIKKSLYKSEFNSSFYFLLSNFEIKIIMFWYLKNSNYSFKFYFMFGCIYPDMWIAYSITSSDRSIEHYIQTL
jgi:hypothetical protein